MSVCSKSTRIPQVWSLSHLLFVCMCVIVCEKAEWMLTHKKTKLCSKEIKAKKKKCKKITSLTGNGKIIIKMQDSQKNPGLLFNFKKYLCSKSFIFKNCKRQEFETLFHSWFIDI